MAVPMEVGHVGKQPTSLNGGLESVSRISKLREGFRKNVTQLQNPRPEIGLSIFFPLRLENQSRHM